VAPELLRLGLLAQVDRAALAAYCQCWAMYVEAVQDIRENGTTFETDKGYQGPRPMVGVAVKMLEKVITFAARFGLTPSDRSRMDMPEAEEPSPFLEFLEQAQRAPAVDDE
jgi:P27 family predicted phage terminase small subunit